MCFFSWQILWFLLQKIGKLLDYFLPSVNSETFAKFFKLGNFFQYFWYHKIEKKKKNPDAHNDFTHKQQKENNLMGFWW
jgi:hypothetical protein